MTPKKTRNNNDGSADANRNKTSDAAATDNGYANKHQRTPNRRNAYDVLTKNK